VQALYPRQKFEPPHILKLLTLWDCNYGGQWRILSAEFNEIYKLFKKLLMGHTGGQTNC
jgi:hypothetical protein